MSSIPFDENARDGRLYASRRNMRLEIKRYTQDDVATKGEAMVPRHRIPGKQTMPPYQDVPKIKVPEARKNRSVSGRRNRRSSRSTERTGTIAVEVPVTNKLEMSEPVCMKGALVMVVPESSLPKQLHPASTERKSRKSAAFASSTATSSTSGIDRTGTTPYGRKLPPLYLPRAGLKEPDEDYEPESEDSEETPWGRRLSGIKVTRVQRDPNEEEYVDVEAPKDSLPVCARCGVVVYMAEEEKAAGRRFHTQCFRCFLCNTGLDSLKVHERNEEIFCKPCYLRQFGPKGYDYGGGEGALRME